MISIRVREDYAGLNFLENNLPREVEKSSKDVAQAIVDYIHANWSDVSPSSPGSSPAVVTGFLDSSVDIDPTGRTLGGQFSSGGNTELWVARVSADYGPYLEDPSIKNRPFVVPAVSAVFSRMPEFYKDVFSVKW